jgi:hypothetical protein
MSSIWKCNEVACDKLFANINSLRRHVLLNHLKKFCKNGLSFLLEGDQLESRLEAAKREQMNSTQRRAKQSRNKILPSEIPSEVLSTGDITNADYSEFSHWVEIPQASYAELNSTSPSGILNWEEMLFEELPFDLEALLHSPERRESNLQMDQNNYGFEISLSNATSAGQNIVSYNIATAFDVDAFGLNSIKSLDDTELNMDVNTFFGSGGFHITE